MRMSLLSMLSERIREGIFLFLISFNRRSSCGKLVMMRPIFWSSRDNSFSLLVTGWGNVSMPYPAASRRAEQIRQNPSSSMISIVFPTAGIQHSMLANMVPTGNYRILKKKVASESVQAGYPCFQWTQNLLSVIQTVMNRELCKAGKIVSERNRFISLCI